MCMTLFIDCQPDESVQENLENDVSLKLERHQVQFRHLRFHNNEAYDIISKLVNGKDDDMNSKTDESYSDEYDLYYNLNRIYEIHGEGYQQFSFLVRSSESSDNQFENYVLVQHEDESFRQFVITYE